LEGEDITLRLIRLRKMRRMMAEAAKEGGGEQAERPGTPDPVQELKRHCSERGDEVIDAAYNENPELVRRVAEALLRALAGGRLEGPIDAGDLLALFRRLGLRVTLGSRVMVYRKGEAKDLRKALEENWRET